MMAEPIVLIADIEARARSAVERGVTEFPYPWNSEARAEWLKVYEQLQTQKEAA